MNTDASDWYDLLLGVLTYFETFHFQMETLGIKLQLPKGIISYYVYMCCAYMITRIVIA